MNPFRLSLTVSIFLLTSLLSFSQVTPENAAPPSPASHALYGEFGGPGLAISANFDTRLSRRKDGFGIYAGIGTNLSGNPTFLTIPAGVNYLMGNGGNYLEAGAGLTYGSLVNSTASTRYTIGSKDFYGNHHLLFGNTILGYRRQPTHGGFNFRVGISPFFGEGAGGVIPYLSIGYNF